MAEPRHAGGTGGGRPRAAALRWRRWLGSPAGYWRRSPATAALLVFWLLAYWVITEVLPPDREAAILRLVSTNVSNMRANPLVALPGSALVIAPPLFSISGLLIVGLGLAGCMAWLERRAGTARALAVFAAGHVGATLLTLPVIEVGISTGHYGPELRTALDFGVSYGSAAVTAAVVGYLPRWARPLWIAAGVGYLLSDATWSGGWPDFTTVGHLAAVVIGVLAALLLDLNRRWVRAAAPAGLSGQGAPAAAD